jgi:hypothetical protein
MLGLRGIGVCCAPFNSSVSRLIESNVLRSMSQESSMGLDPHLYLFDLLKRCAVDSFHAKQDMSNPHFLNYLYEHSRWVEEIFTHSIRPSGGLLEESASLGEGQDQLFSQQDLERFAEELRRVPPPKDNDFLEWNYDNLSHLVAMALSKPNLTLTLSHL